MAYDPNMEECPVCGMGVLPEDLDYVTTRKQELARLQEELAEAKRGNWEKETAMSIELETARASLDRAKKALRFYARGRRFNHEICHYTLDGGETARKALKEIEGE